MVNNKHEFFYKDFAPDLVTNILKVKDDLIKQALEKIGLSYEWVKENSDQILVAGGQCVLTDNVETWYIDDTPIFSIVTMTEFDEETHVYKYHMKVIFPVVCNDLPDDRHCNICRVVNERSIDETAEEANP